MPPSIIMAEVLLRMNNKATKETVVQKRGFYIALYSILAALLILAAVISYNNYTAVTKAREIRAQIAAEDLQAVGASQVESYLASRAAPTHEPPSSGTSPGLRATPAPRSAPVTPAPRPVPVTPAPGTAPAAPRTAPTVPAQQPAPATNPTPAQSTPAQSTPSAGAQAQPVETTQSSTPNTSPATGGQQEKENESADPNAILNTPTRNNRTSEFASPIVEVFTEGNTMRWPVLGEVVMDYSSDHMVYDRTLEQFRTNNVLCIATDIGTPVQAAAGGVVRSVTNSRELGNTIILDHGNGWSTFYSQLQDGVLVKEGDVVNAGQVIGGVGAPSLYYVLLGNHLGFSVSYNDSYLDPKQLLE